MRAPMAIMLASLCSRPRRAVTGSVAWTQRMPRILLATICSPRAAAAEDDAEAAVAGRHGTRRRRDVVGIVDGLVAVHPEVDDLVAVLAEPVDDELLEGQAGVVGGDGDAHQGTGPPMRSSGRPVGLRDAEGGRRSWPRPPRRRR